MSSAPGPVLVFENRTKRRRPARRAESSFIRKAREVEEQYPQGASFIEKLLDDLLNRKVESK